MKSKCIIFLGLLILVACQSLPGAAPTAVPPTEPSRPTEYPTLKPVEAVLPTLPPPTPALGVTPEPTVTPTPLPPPFAGTLALASHKPLPANCNFASPFSLPSQGLLQLAFLPTGECVNGELDLFETGGRVYIAQSGYSGVAFTITDVTDPAHPKQVGVWEWQPHGVTADLKAFHQGARQYLALSLQRSPRPPNMPCGVAIVEVTKPDSPQFVTRIDGRTAGGPDAWCNVHTSEVATDAADPSAPPGNATFLYASDVDTYSLRVVDLRDLAHPREVNSYHLHDHPHALPDQPPRVYVHDSAVVGERVYVGYWLGGAVILDRQKLEAGMPQEGVIIKPTQDVAPGGFHVHYLYPAGGGDFLFVEDELNIQNGLRLLDIRNPQNVREVWQYQVPNAFNAPHNFVIENNLLYAGWYQDGIRVFRVDLSNPDKPQVEPIAFQAVRAQRGEGDFGPFDGVWGVRVHPCTAQSKPTMCIFASDISAGLIITALDPTLNR